MPESTLATVRAFGEWACIRLSNRPSGGLGSLHTIGFGGVALALLTAFIVRQARGRNPILPLRIFRSRKLSTANIIQALMSSAFFGFFFLGSLDLERVLGYSPLRLGLAFLPRARYPWRTTALARRPHSPGATTWPG